MIVTVPTATRSVRIWAKGGSTVIEVDGLAEQSPMGAFFGMDTWHATEAPALRQRLRVPRVAAIGVVGAALVAGIGIHVIFGSDRPTFDGAALSADQVGYAQPSAPPVFPNPPPSFAQEIAQPAQPAAVPPRRAVSGPNAAFGLD